MIPAESIPKVLVSLILLIVLLFALKLGLRLAAGVTAEGFASPPGMPSGIGPWIRSDLDRLARRGQSCGVQDVRNDEELEGAVIQIVDATCESGLPHTTDGNTVRMTRAMWDDKTRRENVLVHERLHLRQKREPELWKRFYTERWGYTDFRDQPPAEAPRLAVRGNPDTADSPWVCWQNRYWFTAVYRDTKEPSISRSSVAVWDSKTGAVSHDPPHEWQSFFCGRECPHQWEHPHEISAEFIAATQKGQSAAEHHLEEFLRLFPGGKIER
jgi:hypothetical protein